MTPAPTSRGEDEFDRFWSDYPRKVSKARARTTFLKRRKKGISLDVILAGLDRYMRTEWKGRDADKIPHASTWLNAWDPSEETDMEASLTEWVYA